MSGRELERLLRSLCALIGHEEVRRWRQAFWCRRSVRGGVCGDKGSRLSHVVLCMRAYVSVYCGQQLMMVVEESEMVNP